MGFAVSEGFVLMWVLFGLYGFYAAASEGVTKAWVSDLIPGELRGTAIGLITTCVSLATMSGSVLTGVLWDSFGSSVPFLISSIVSVLIALLLIKLK